VYASLTRRKRPAQPRRTRDPIRAELIGTNSATAPQMVVISAAPILGLCRQLVAGGAKTDETGNMLTVRNQRPRLLSDLSPDLCKVIEDVDVDAKGNVIPRLYSKLQANRELRQMLNIGGQKERPETDVSRLSDAELIQQLADQAKELGIEIDLNYRFYKRDE
jgi:hypothetical protein